MENLRGRLAKYPSSFRASDALDKFSREEKEQRIKKTLDYIDSEEDMEKLRDWNFLSFMCYKTGQFEQARMWNYKVLQKCDNNMISVANKAWFDLEEKRDLRECELACSQLENMQKDRNLLLFADAEIAFTFSRLGMECYPRSSELFKDIIKRADELCTEAYHNRYMNPVPSEILAFWLFDYALVLRRQLHIPNNNFRKPEYLPLSDENYREVLKLYCRIIEMGESNRGERKGKVGSARCERGKNDASKRCEHQEEEVGSNNCLNRVIAKSYVEIGSIASKIEHAKHTGSRLKALLPKKSKLLMPVREYFIKALGTFWGDSYVLERSAAYFRKMKQYDFAKYLLDKTCSKTSFNYHHMALTVLRELEEKRCTWPLIQSKAALGLSPAHAQLLHTRPDNSKYMRHAVGNTMHTKRYDRNQTSYLEWNIGTEIKGVSFNRERQCLLFNYDVESRRRTKTETEMCCTEDTIGQKMTAFSNTEMKCPLNPRAINYDTHTKVVDEIFYFLDKAVELSETNCMAVYDKALLYRQIGQWSRALSQFEDITKRPNGTAPPLIKACSYEQAALCILDMWPVDDISADLKFKLLTYLMSSVEISNGMKEKLPSHKSSNSLSILGLVLDRICLHPEDCRYILFYCENIEDYQKAMEKLERSEPIFSERPKKTDMLKLKAKILLRQNKYADAAKIFELLKQQDVFHMRVKEDVSLYLKVHIKAGLDALISTDEKTAQLYIKDALAFAEDEKNTCENVQYDLFILCDLNDGENGNHLTEILNKMGLRTTSTADSGYLPGIETGITPGMPVDLVIKDCITKSKHFAIVNDFDTEDIEMSNKMQHYIDQIRNVITERRWRSALVIITRPEAEVPPMLRCKCEKCTCTCEIDLASVSDSCLRDKNMFVSFEKLLMAIMSCHTEP